MFNRKAKKIKELQKKLDLISTVLDDTQTTMKDKDTTISSLRKELDDLYQEKARLNLDFTNLKEVIRVLSVKLNTSTRINKKLKNDVKELSAKVEHTKEVNRNRQRRFREAHKDDNK